MPETQRLKLIVSYDGGPFAGWQSQRRGRTVQDELEKAFAQICGEKISVPGAGRTDAGVHAFGQCAHADVPREKLTLGRWQNALNGQLPPTIRVEKLTETRPSFHARFSARGKIYRYRIANTEILSPLELGRVWHVRVPLDFPLLNRAGESFVGRHDFAAFAANRGHPPTETIRTIAHVAMRKRYGLIEIDVCGDGFLYKMARFIVGAMVRCASGRETVENVRRQLRDGIVHGERLVAPAGGLYLLRVRY